MSLDFETEKRNLEDAVTGRRSIRRFLERPVAIETVHHILAAASRAPSGTNSQPWHVHVVTGEAQRSLSQAVITALDAELVRQPYYPYFPADVGEPYQGRRAAFGIGLSALDGFNRRDPEGLKNALRWNYRFFGAPVGLFFCLDRNMLNGSWVDIGMFMQNVMILARSKGLDTCAQVSWTNYGSVVHRELPIPQDHIIVAGMSLGHADRDAAPNQLKTERAPVETFTTFHS